MLHLFLKFMWHFYKAFGCTMVTRQLPVDGSFPSRPIILQSGASRMAYSSTSTLEDGDVQAAPGSTCKVLAPGVVENEVDDLAFINYLPLNLPARSWHHWLILGGFNRENVC